MTSQVPLAIAGEQIYPVDPLTKSDAEALLLEYACRKDRQFKIEVGNRDQIDELLVLTDRMPFCIELAAAKVRPGRSVERVIEGIRTSLTTLEAFEIPSGRHRSVRACLNWSFNLLTAEQQSLLAKLSVFRGGFVAEDVASICNEPRAAELLEILSDASLLRRSRDRYVMLPTAQEYAADRLGGGQGARQRRHAEHYLLKLEKADQMIQGQQQLQGFDVIRNDIGNFRRGLNWSGEQRAYEMVARYVWSLSGNLYQIGRGFEEVAMALKGLEAARLSSGVNLIAASLNNLGNAYLHCRTGDRAENVRLAIRCYEAALKDYSKEEHAFSWAMTHLHLGSAQAGLIGNGYDAKHAVSHYEKALEVFTERRYPKWWATTHYNFGLVFTTNSLTGRASDIEKAIEHLNASLRIRTEADLPVDWADSQNCLGIAHSLRRSGKMANNLEEAMKGFEAALRIRRRDDFPDAWAQTQANMANAYLNLKKSPEGLLSAVSCCEGALSVWNEQDDTGEWARCVFTLALAKIGLAGIEGVKVSDETLRLVEAAMRGFESVGLQIERNRAKVLVVKLRKASRSRA